MTDHGKYFDALNVPQTLVDNIFYKQVQSTL